MHCVEIPSNLLVACIKQQGAVQEACNQGGCFPVSETLAAFKLNVGFVLKYSAFFVLNRRESSVILK